MHRCMWLAYPEGFNSIEYSVILHWTIMSHSDFSENLSPIGFLGDLDWWFCICTAYRHLLIFRIDNVIIVRIRIWISDWYWLWANLNTHLLKKSLCDMDITIAKCKTFRFTATTTLKCILYADMWIFCPRNVFLRCFPKNVTVWHAQSWCPGMNGLGGGPDSFLWSLVHILNRFLKISLQLTRCKI